MKISIVRLIKNILFLFFSFMLITYILLEIFASHKTLDIIGYKSYVVVSSSMEPDIMVNDMILIRNVKEEKLEIDDAITFLVYIPELGYESEVTHYIGDIQDLGDDGIIYKTQGATYEVGDYDTWKDENNEVIEITYEDIEGKVILTIPYLGHVVNIVKDPILIGSIVANILIVYLLVKTIKKPKKDEESSNDEI